MNEPLHVAVSIDGENWVKVGVTAEPPEIRLEREYADVDFGYIYSIPVPRVHRFSMDLTVQMTDEDYQRLGQAFLW